MSVELMMESPSTSLPTLDGSSHSNPIPSPKQVLSPKQDDNIFKHPDELHESQRKQLLQKLYAYHQNQQQSKSQSYINKQSISQTKYSPYQIGIAPSSTSRAQTPAIQSPNNSSSNLKHGIIKQSVNETNNTLNKQEGEGEGIFDFKEWFNENIELGKNNEEYMQLLIDNGFNMLQPLKTVKEDDLEKIGIKLYGHRKVIYEEIQKL